MRSYSWLRDVFEEDWLALVNAEGVVEIARNLADAAQTAGVSAGAEIRMRER